mmetsp:Transcript_43368/g.50180  ORF Transcript_43368/g.50180 Transcript_43368/m.50180 type:complete len:132 (-) Transcript_43368:216-611(-)|eukprot:CAMPEP_0176448376 /NCGR_PEP_ID=MMETSP0127-20121128/25726_1 /TAXON_ID=938130 /ORGANISM="Platyophrya macrostoma, Strain WH" /LENGTH=131 /DNA_ID=CAMNT_0017835273 /DNA_START=55 /DNA_END=450 /DNA_ORIENTATION=-
MRRIFESKEITDFKDKLPYESRRTEASNALEKNPGLIPVIFLKKKTSKTADFDRRRYLFKKDWKVSEIIAYLREKINQNPEAKDKAKKVLFLTLRGNVSPLATCTLQNLYEDYVDEDGFLYIVYSEEDFTG